MSKRRNKRRLSRWLLILPYSVELAAYAGVVTAYFFLVLHFLGGAVENLYQTNKATYALVSLALICGQGVLLEVVTSMLLRVFQRWFQRQ